MVDYEEPPLRPGEHWAELSPEDLEVAKMYDTSGGKRKVFRLRVLARTPKPRRNNGKV